MTLYKKSTDGTIHQWSIEAIKDRFIVTYGRKGGKMQTKTTVCTPKNVGKSNERTASEQAIKEMKSTIKSKLKKGYSKDIKGEPTVMLPMKVKAYQDNKTKVRFPCMSTYKIDGINATYKKLKGKLVLLSRGGEELPKIPHLEQDVLRAMDIVNSNELNGELYIDNKPLQDIQSAVMKPNNLSFKLKFAVFDIADTNEPYKTRHIRLRILDDKMYKRPNITVLLGKKCESFDDIEAEYHMAIKLGYEGTVIKNLKGLYVHNKRSSDQFKYKKVQEAEFLISSYKVDKNGNPTFILKVNDDTFMASPVGTDEERKEILKNIKSYLHKWGTVAFERYSKKGIPLKPIFKCVRNCDANGNPLA